jgi:hypothetical protein
MIGVSSPERCTSAIHDPQPPLIGPFSERIRSHRDEPERPWADPIYCAETLSEAFLYLPTCEYFKSAFMWRTEQKLVNERIVQYKTATRIKPIYYVIDGEQEIYTSTCVLFQSAFPLPDLPTAVVPNSPGAVSATSGAQSMPPSLTQTLSREQKTSNLNTHTTAVAQDLVRILYAALTNYYWYRTSLCKHPLSFCYSRTVPSPKCK